MTALEKLDRIPPKLCRVLAREKGRPMSLKRIVNQSGLGLRTVRWITRQDSWAFCSVDEMDRFSRACGVRLLNVARVNEYLKRQEEVNKTAFPYLKHSKRPDHYQKLMQ